jgi:hypothetical protein
MVARIQLGHHPLGYCGVDQQNCPTPKHASIKSTTARPEHSAIAEVMRCPQGDTDGV